MTAKEALLVEIEKRIRTTFIGAVASIEESHFGRLRDKEGWDQEFQRLREEILDKGNDQIRAIKKKMEDFQVAPARKYKYKLEMKDPRDRNGDYNGSAK